MIHSGYKVNKLGWVRRIERGAEASGRAEGGGALRRSRNEEARANTAVKPPHATKVAAIAV